MKKRKLTVVRILASALAALAIFAASGCLRDDSGKEKDSKRFPVPEFTAGEKLPEEPDGDTLYLSYTGVGPEEYASYLEEVTKAGFKPAAGAEPSGDRGGLSWSGKQGDTLVTVSYHGAETFYYSVFGHNLMIEIVNTA